MSRDPRSDRRHSPLARAVVLAAAMLLAAMPAGTVRRAGAPGPQQAAASARSGIVSFVTVAVPADDAELAVEGATLPGHGPSRSFETRPLEAGTYQYTFTVTWRPNTYTTMTRTKTVTFRAGEPVAVDLTTEDPADRVRVIYVPTPADVAEAMADLAGVTPTDVVFEPGCGDARITIAAIRKGARRAICVDIDPERAKESRANVERAGLDDRIDVRLGDALDVKDLSGVTVVFLYMGDHFNLLIRPVLWRELPAGARVVSHRFRMGDWEPDRTIWVPSAEGGQYELHLWTVTDEVKRRSGSR